MTRPNILFIMCDQFRFDCISALGNPYVLTPNLDRLVSRGLHFTNAYSTCPVCVPARYTLRTGREPWHTGCYSNEVPVPMDGQAAQMEDRCGPYLARVMSSLGYRTFGVGKFHTHPDPYEELGYESFMPMHELWATPEERARDAFAGFILREHPEYAHIHQIHGERTNMYYMPQMSPLPAELTAEAYEARLAADEIYKIDPRPYFGFVSFLGPHPPCAPPSPYHLLYDPDAMPNPVSGDKATDHMDEQIPWMNRAIWADELNDFAARNLRSRYLAEITYIDHCLGQVLDAVEKRGDAQNTLIAFFSDHGDFLGDHHAWQKESYFEQSARIPMLISLPGQIPVGQNDALVCLTDLFSLATAMAGQEDTRDGISLWGAIQGAARRDHLFAVYGRPGTPLFKCMVRKGHMKYIFMSNGDREQLFDLRRDPHELHNLAGDASKEFRSIAQAECRRPGLFQALDNGRLRVFPYTERPRIRIRQVDASHGDAAFTGTARLQKQNASPEPPQ